MNHSRFTLGNGLINFEIILEYEIFFFLFLAAHSKYWNKFFYKIVNIQKITSNESGIYVLKFFYFIKKAVQTEFRYTKKVYFLLQDYLSVGKKKPCATKRFIFLTQKNNISFCKKIKFFERFTHYRENLSNN